MRKNHVARTQRELEALGEAAGQTLYELTPRDRINPKRGGSGGGNKYPNLSLLPPPGCFQNLPLVKLNRKSEGGSAGGVLPRGHLVGTQSRAQRTEQWVGTGQGRRWPMRGTSTVAPLVTESQLWSFAWRETLVCSPRVPSASASPRAVGSAPRRRKPKLWH